MGGLAQNKNVQDSLDQRKNKLNMKYSLKLQNKAWQKRLAEQPEQSAEPATIEDIVRLNELQK